MPAQESSQMSEVKQIGIAVRDMEAAIKFYSDVLGFGPFQVQELKLEGCIYRGKQGNCRLKIAFGQSGPLQVELIQVLEGERPFNEFLLKKGEGVHHVRIDVESLENALDKMAKDGIKPIFSHVLPEAGMSFALIDSDKIGGLQVELVEFI